MLKISSNNNKFFFFTFLFWFNRVVCGFFLSKFQRFKYQTANLCECKLACFKSRKKNKKIQFFFWKYFASKCLFFNTVFFIWCTIFCLMIFLLDATNSALFPSKNYFCNIFDKLTFDLIIYLRYLYKFAHQNAMMTMLF